MTPESEKKKDDQPKKRKGLSPAFIIIGAVFLLGIILQHIFGLAGLLDDGKTRVFSVVVGLFSFTVVVAVGWNRRLQRFFASNRFGVPVVLAATFLSIVGTLILQGESQKALQVAYGSALGVIQALFLHDVFHSFGFTALLGLGAGGLALVVSRKRRLTPRYLGSLGAHIGLLLVLAGAAVGSVWGVKGRLNMHKGESSDRFFVAAPGGGMVARPLGFVLRLDDFKLLHYTPEYRLMVFEVDGKKEKRLVSVDPASEETGELRAFGVEVLDYWPDYVREPVVEPVAVDATSAKKPLSALGLKTADGKLVWIFDEGAPSGGRPPGPSGAVLAFFWDKERAENFINLMDAGASSPHLIVVGDQKIAVGVGQTYPIPGTDHSIKVLRSFTDFVMDPATRQPQNRSGKPNNPAIEIEVKDAAGKQLKRSWMFSKHPDFHHGAGDAPTAKLRYIYQGGSGSRSVEVVAVGELAELWTLVGGVVSKGKLEVGGALKFGGATLTVHALHPSVRRSYKDTTRSDRADNPVVKVRIKNFPRPQLLGLKRPVRLDERRVLVMAAKGGETVRDYLSVLSVLDQGQLVQTKTIEVNDPLEYGGFALYQADYRPEDPTFSGFQVVRDPGLWIVYLGFFINLLGVAWAVFGPPIVKRRKAARRSGGAGS